MKAMIFWLKTKTFKFWSATRWKICCSSYAPCSHLPPQATIPGWLTLPKLLKRAMVQERKWSISHDYMTPVPSGHINALAHPQCHFLPLCTNVSCFYFKKKKKSNSLFHDANVLASTLDLMMAGTETTSTTLQWAILLMKKYPEIQGDPQFGFVPWRPLNLALKKKRMAISLMWRYE